MGTFEIVLIACIIMAVYFFMNQHGLKTTVVTKSKNVQIISDIDEITGESYHFKWNNKIHKIKPVDLVTFLMFTQRNHELLTELKSNNKKLPKDLLLIYLSVFNSVCETISLKDLETSEQAQIAAVYQIIIDVVTGQVDTGDGKKKRIRLPIYEYGDRLLSQNVQESLAGQ